MSSGFMSPLCVLLALVLLTLTASASGTRRTVSSRNYRFNGRWMPCYRNPPVGCFPMTASQDNAQGFWPLNPRSLNIEFHHYQSQGQRLRSFPLNDTVSVMNGTFHPERKTVVVTHGYMEGHEVSWMQQMVTELLTQEQEPVNVFAVDWSTGSNNLIYFQSVANTRVVGAVIALFLRALMSLEAEPSKIHLIGYSLGAHTMGHAGKRLPGLGRITGLDPAGPSFTGTHIDCRLDATDATFVDVIHTNAAPANVLDMGKGTITACGHVDFYPNGGMLQPGCPNSVMDSIYSFFNSWELSRNSIVRSFGCSHIRAPQLFVASIRHHCTPTSHKCASIAQLNNNACAPCQDDDCPSLGYHLNTSITYSNNIINPTTTGASPYC